MSSIRFVIFTALAALYVAICTLSLAADPIRSTWRGDGDNSNWFDSGNWSTGVPTQAGDSAIVYGNVFASNRPLLSGPISLGKLEFSMFGGQTTLGGTGLLTFDQPGDAPALLVVESRTILSATVTAPWAIAVGETLNVQVPERRALRMEGDLSSTAGDIVLTGGGSLFSSVRSNWTGQLTIESGLFEAKPLSPNPLGSTAGITIVKSQGQLQLVGSSTENITLQGGGFYSAGGIHSGEIYLAQISKIGQRYLPDGNSALTDPMTISGRITGPGDIEFLNDPYHPLSLNGSNDYEGVAYVRSGTVMAKSAMALGSTNAGTVISGSGTLEVHVANDETYEVRGGTLRFNAASAVDAISPNQVVLKGGTVVLPAGSIPQPIVLDGEGIVKGSGSSTLWTAGSSGTGDLEVGGSIRVNAPLMHTGNTTFVNATINVANFYTGSTLISGTTIVNHPGAFGASTTPIVVDRGSLVLPVALEGNRQIHVQHGELNVPSAIAIDSPVRLGGGYGSTLEGQGIFSQPIDYVSSQSGYNAEIQGGTFNAPLRGSAELWFTGSGTTNLNAANEIEGPLRAQGGNVVVNHSQALQLSHLWVQGGVVQLNTPVVGVPVMTAIRSSSTATIGTLQLNVPQELDRTWYVERGTVQANANIAFHRMLNENSHYTSIGQGQTQLVDGMRVIGSGFLSGKVVGQGDIRLSGTSLGVTGNLGSYTGDFVVRHGQLALGSAPSGAAPYLLNAASAIHLYPNGSVNFGDVDKVVANDIYFHGTHPVWDNLHVPMSFGGEAWINLTGNIHVGDAGAKMSSNFLIRGAIRGSNLTLVDGTQTLLTPQTELTGTLHLERKGVVSLGAAGTLQSLSQIKLNDGTLHLTPSSNRDRIADSTTVVSQGGSIVLDYDTAPKLTTETIGSLELGRGMTIVSLKSEVGQTTAKLILGRLERNTGSLIRFQQAESVTTMQIQEVDRFDGQMLGAWAHTDTGFASINQQGIVRTLAATSTSINTATATDHVRATTLQTLTADRVIGSLIYQPSSVNSGLDLGGHRLTVRSGGIRTFAGITNGTLTAGTGEPTELILTPTAGDRSIGANIVDNGPAGNVALVVSRSVRLTGTNTYTGGTWVVGDRSPETSFPAQLIIGNLAAIPANDRVHLDLAEYNVSLATAGVVQLSELHVRGGSWVRGNRATIDADAYYLEEGSTDLPLTGDGTIHKDSSGDFWFGYDSASPSFTGDVLLRDGQLVIPYNSIPNSKIRVQGGQLVGGTSTGLASPVILDGGQLKGAFLGDIEVATDSSLYAEPATTLSGTLKGNATLTVRGSSDASFNSRAVILAGDAREYTGDLVVESGALRIYPQVQLGTGQIVVEEGARLELSSRTPQDGTTTITRDIHIHSGTLLSYTSTSSTNNGQSPNSILASNVFVHGEAILGTNAPGLKNGQEIPAMDFAGTVMLDDNAAVFTKYTPFERHVISSAALVEVSGQLQVGKNTTWNVGKASLAITGTIEAAADEASIDFQGVPSTLQLNTATFVASANSRLRVTQNGEPLDLTLQGPTAGIAGDGTVNGDFALTTGATLAPGQSPGTLVIQGDLELGPGAAYQWELGDSAWDQVHVDGTLNFSSTVGEPWQLVLSEYQTEMAYVDSEWLIATADEILGFDPTTLEIVTSGLSDRIRNDAAAEFFVEQRGSELYLVLAVPEPSAMVVAMLLVAGGAVLQRRKRTCRSK